MAINVVDRARALESRIAKALNRVAEHAVGVTARQPLEIVHAVVDAVESQIQSGGRGQRLFPFDTVAVAVVAPSREARAHIEAVFNAAPSLRERVIDRLRASGCDVGHIEVDVSYVARPARSWQHPQFHVSFDRRVAAPVAAASDVSTRIELTVVRGAADPRTYAASGERIDLGRGLEVRDRHNRLLRTNHVVFTEGAGGENDTVSRRHAHVAFDAASGEHRLHDDGSVHGTGIVRGGRSIPVPPGSRGVRLRSGDEIVLGEARLRIRIGES